MPRDVYTSSLIKLTFSFPETAGGNKTTTGRIGEKRSRETKTGEGSLGQTKERHREWRRC